MRIVRSLFCTICDLIFTFPSSYNQYEPDLCVATDNPQVLVCAISAGCLSQTPDLQGGQYRAEPGKAFPTIHLHPSVQLVQFDMATQANGRPDEALKLNDPPQEPSKINGRPKEPSKLNGRPNEASKLNDRPNGVITKPQRARPTTPGLAARSFSIVARSTQLT